MIITENNRKSAVNRMWRKIMNLPSKTTHRVAFVDVNVLLQQQSRAAASFLRLRLSSTRNIFNSHICVCNCKYALLFASIGFVLLECVCFPFLRPHSIAILPLCTLSTYFSFSFSFYLSSSSTAHDAIFWLPFRQC